MTTNNQKLFFIIGPLRTGSSLMARCIDDHPAAICLCESEINRLLFPDHFLKLHWARMYRHGLEMSEMIDLLERKKQNSISDIEQWYKQIFSLMKNKYQKDQAKVIGDKSPDFYRSEELVKWMSEKYPLIYTTRDPRAILRSINAQNRPQDEKENRWNAFQENFQQWRPLLKKKNILISKYENLILNPETTMKKVYQHLGLEYSDRFLTDFKRPSPERFLWKTAIDLKTGRKKDFDISKSKITDEDLTPEELDLIYNNPTVVNFMEEFNYKQH